MDRARGRRHKSAWPSEVEDVGNKRLCAEATALAVGGKGRNAPTGEAHVQEVPEEESSAEDRE